MATEKLQKKRKCPECKLMLMHKDVVGEIVECPRCGSQTPLKGFLQQEKREKALKIIADLSDRGDLPEAVKFYKQSKDLLTPAGRTEATRELLSMFVPRWRALLGNGEFTNADVLFTCLERAIGNQDLEDLYAERTLAEKEWAVKSLVRRATEILRSDGFSQADKFFYGEDNLPRDRYLAAKAEFFRQICSNKVLRPLTQEQATAVVDPASHVLVKARAGSGKTTTLTAKALFLLKHYGINPTEILLLTFNRNARSEIKQRLEKAMHNTRIQNVFTFHSLAYNLVNPKCEILFNSGGDFSTKALAAYVRKIVRGMWNPAFKLKLYWYFREEMKEREPTDLDLGPQEYLEYRRNLTQVTLRGEKVKSVGEKYIADCLCEHDIKYRYEEVFFWGGRIYRPDFTLLTGAKKRIVIEHWGIDEKDESHSVPLYWDQSWEEYRNEMEDKRRYWNSSPSFATWAISRCAATTGFRVALQNRRIFHWY